MPRCWQRIAAVAASAAVVGCPRWGRWGGGGHWGGGWRAAGGGGLVPLALTLASCLYARTFSVACVLFLLAHVPRGQLCIIGLGRSRCCFLFLHPLLRASLLTSRPVGAQTPDPRQRLSCDLFAEAPRPAAGGPADAQAWASVGDAVGGARRSAVDPQSRHSSRSFLDSGEVRWPPSATHSVLARAV